MTKLFRAVCLAGAMGVLSTGALEARQPHHDAFFLLLRDHLGGTVSTAISPAVAAAIAEAAALILAQLQAGTLTTPDGFALDDDAQELVLGVIMGTIPPSVLQDILEQSGAIEAAEGVAGSMVGLLTEPAVGQVAAAMGHFNTLVLGASTAFLANPPPAFQVVWAILAGLSAAAWSAP